MRQLIEVVRAEAQKIIDAEHNDDEYHKDALLENQRKRDEARSRIKECDDALEAISDAAKSLVGKK